MLKFNCTIAERIISDLLCLLICLHIMKLKSRPSRIRDTTYGAVGWTKHWVNVLKCAHTIVFLASNSLNNLGGQK